jgi:hypothetical protein
MYNDRMQFGKNTEHKAGALPLFEIFARSFEWRLNFFDPSTGNG